MFTKNEGIIDRLLRGVLAVVFFVLAVSGIWSIGFYILAVVMLITAVTGFCALYKIFNFSTNKKTK